MTVTVGVRCDAGAQRGVGHLVRCVALAEELVGRGVVVKFLSDLGGLSWAEQQLARRGLPWHPAPYDPIGLVAACDRLGLDALVVDSYTLPPEHSAAVRRTGRTVLAIVDGDFRGQSADIYVDQNLDATIPAGDALGLAGLDYALLRDSVRQLRPPAAPVHLRHNPNNDNRAHHNPNNDNKARNSNFDNRASRTPKVVAFFGGTDAYRAAPQIAALLVATGAAFDATVVAADDSLRAELVAVESGPGQHFEIISPTDDLPKLLAGADLAVSASGTSTWELLCLGLASALVWVVDNQILGYERTIAHGFAAGLGQLGHFTPGSVDVLRELLTVPDMRTALAARAWSAVDGRGVERVADALLAALR